MQGVVCLVFTLFVCAFALPQSSRLIGGENVQRGETPYQLSLQYKAGGMVFSHVCGATVVSANWALTAAQCRDSFDLSRYRVVAGLLELNQVNPDAQISGLDEFILHPSYRGGVSTNDIALLLLTKPLTWTETVQQITLNLSPGDLSGSANLTSWGHGTSLKKATLKLITNQQCAQVLKTATGSSEPLDNTQVCTDVSTSSACSDDLGSPLVQSGAVVGVMSWNKLECGSVPASHTKVSSHEKFIRDNVFDLP